MIIFYYNKKVYYEKKETNYYAIIPASVRYNKNLNANAKLLYGEITALCNQQGYCWATNKYFAELYSVSETSISLWIKKLIDNNYIESNIEKNFNRKIYLKGVLRKVKGGIKKSSKGVLRKVKHNNTYNNINNNTSNILSKSKDLQETKTKICPTKNSEGTRNPTNEIINIFFYQYSKNNRLFAMKCQRTAVEDLIKQFDIESVIKFAEFAISCNGKPYAPQITTPLQLQSKMGQLRAFTSN